MKIIAVVFALSLAACVESPTIDEVSAPITAADCHAHDVGHKVAMCHATNSAMNPYVQVNVDLSGCINGHSDHKWDYFPDENGNCGDQLPLLMSSESGFASVSCPADGCHATDIHGQCYRVCI